MSMGESSAMVSLYLVILFAQLRLTEPFHVTCSRKQKPLKKKKQLVMWLLLTG